MVSLSHYEMKVSIMRLAGFVLANESRQPPSFGVRLETEQKRSSSITLNVAQPDVTFLCAGRGSVMFNGHNECAASSTLESFSSILQN